MEGPKKLAKILVIANVLLFIRGSRDAACSVIEDGGFSKDHQIVSSTSSHVYQAGSLVQCSSICLGTPGCGAFKRSGNCEIFVNVLTLKFDAASNVYVRNSLALPETTTETTPTTATAAATTTTTTGATTTTTTLSSTTTTITPPSTTSTAVPATTISTSTTPTSTGLPMIPTTATSTTTTATTTTLPTTTTTTTTLPTTTTTTTTLSTTTATTTTLPTTTTAITRLLAASGYSFYQDNIWVKVVMPSEDVTWAQALANCKETVSAAFLFCPRSTADVEQMASWHRSTTSQKDDEFWIGLNDADIEAENGVDGQVETVQPWKWMDLRVVNDLYGMQIDAGDTSDQDYVAFHLRSNNEVRLNFKTVDSLADGFICEVIV